MGKSGWFLATIVLMAICYLFLIKIEVDQIARVEAGGERSEIGDICKGAAGLAVIVALFCFFAGSSFESWRSGD